MFVLVKVNFLLKSNATYACYFSRLSKPPTLVSVLYLSIFKRNSFLILLVIVQNQESTVEAIRSSAASRFELITNDSELYKYAHTLVVALKQ